MPGGLADCIAVILEIEIELAVGVAERIGVDRAAELELADQRLGSIRDERPGGVGEVAAPMHWRPVLPLLGGEIEDEAVAVRITSGAQVNPPLAQAGRTGRASCILAVADREDLPVDEVGRDRHLHIGAAAMGLVA